MEKQCVIFYQAGGNMSCFYPDKASIKTAWLPGRKSALLNTAIKMCRIKL
jgi:hypothetical protein